MNRSRETKKLLKKKHEKRETIFSNKGESIAETLIALLIASVALVMLASMIQSTNSLVLTSENKMNEYYEANMELESYNSPRTATIIISTQSGSPSLNVSVQNVPYQGNSVFSNNPVFAYSP